MRVGIDARTIGKGATGDEVYTRNLIANLPSDGATYFLFTDTKEKADLLRSIRQSRDSVVITVEPASKALWTFFLLPIACKKHAIDVLHVQYICPPVLPRGVKLVTTVHDVSWRYYPGLVRHKDRIALNALIPLSLARADVVITDTEFSRRAIIANYGSISPREIEVVYLGGGISRSEAAECNERPFFPGIGANAYFVYIGSMQPRKNLPFMIRSFARIRLQYPGIKLVIAGARGYNCDPGIEEAIIDCNAVGDVMFTGYIDEDAKRSLLAHAIALVFPSLFEGFGIPVLEAFSMGCPVIASDNSCLPEIAGGNAILVRPDDEEGLASQMSRLSDDYLSSRSLRAQLSEGGAKRVEDFSWESMAMKTAEVYRRLGSRF